MSLTSTQKQSHASLTGPVGNEDEKCFSVSISVYPSENKFSSFISHERSLFPISIPNGEFTAGNRIGSSLPSLARIAKWSLQPLIADNRTRVCTKITIDAYSLINQPTNPDKNQQTKLFIFNPADRTNSDFLLATTCQAKMMLKRGSRVQVKFMRIQGIPPYTKNSNIHGKIMGSTLS